MYSITILNANKQYFFCYKPNRSKKYQHRTAKKSLFNPFTGWMFRALGGAPVIRKRNEKQVDAIARLFDKYEEFRMVIAPEGTRKKVKQWKTGFYYIAKQANVPIVMFTLDFKNKENEYYDDNVNNYY